MVIENLKNKTVFLDTAPLIYFIEGHATYEAILGRLFYANDSGLFQFITSSITLLEVLVVPLRNGRRDIVEKYKNLLTKSKGIELFEINNNIAVLAAELRAKHNLKPPDALQLATAIEYGADYFLTNDFKLNNISKIKMLRATDLM